MVAVVKDSCLDKQLGHVKRLTARGEFDTLRVVLEGMLRCAARLGCDRAVTCSDDASAGIRQLLVAV